MSKELTIEMLAEKALAKAGSRRNLAKQSGLSRATVDNILNGTNTTKHQARTVGALTVYALKDEKETPTA